MSTGRWWGWIYGQGTEEVQNEACRVQSAE
ncbi:MAG: hypothetical protein JWL69_1370 [Phycisphaerales bacterium]|nr:hypothetical protein [Phycisphaerales bacterium]MDB5353733.1 hypothetical protein [Phycisphaerales bacterium]